MTKFRTCILALLLGTLTLAFAQKQESPKYSSTMMSMYNHLIKNGCTVVSTGYTTGKELEEEGITESLHIDGMLKDKSFSILINCAKDTTVLRDLLEMYKEAKETPPPINGLLFLDFNYDRDEDNAEDTKGLIIKLFAGCKTSK